MAYEHKNFSEFKIGDKTSYALTVTEAHVVNFAGATGDFNPLHLNEEYAKKTMFKGRIVHGLFVASLLGMVGAPFFGSGAVNVGQNIKYLAPTRVGDTIDVRIEVTGLKPEKNIVLLRTYVVNQDGVTVLDGDQVVKIVDKKD